MPSLQVIFERSFVPENLLKDFYAYMTFKIYLAFDLLFCPFLEL